MLKCDARRDFRLKHGELAKNEPRCALLKLRWFEILSTNCIFSTKHERKGKKLDFFFAWSLRKKHWQISEILVYHDNFRLLTLCLWLIRFCTVLLRRRESSSWNKRQLLSCCAKCTTSGMPALRQQHQKNSLLSTRRLSRKGKSEMNKWINGFAGSGTLPLHFAIVMSLKILSISLEWKSQLASWLAWSRWSRRPQSGSRLVSNVVVVVVRSVGRRLDEPFIAATLLKLQLALAYSRSGNFRKLLRGCNERTNCWLRKYSIELCYGVSTKAIWTCLDRRLGTLTILAKQYVVWQRMPWN